MTDLLSRSAEATHAARVALLNGLQTAGYDFVSPTPGTHRLVADRLARARAGDLRDIFGWGRPFGAADLAPALLAALEGSGGLTQDGPVLRSALRVSRLDERLHLHSMRGGDPNAVFLGPDSYRFVRFLHALLDGAAPGRVLDIGTGAGAGALALAVRCPDAEVVAGDINPLALALTAANAVHSGCRVALAEGPGLVAAPGDFDLIVANPPYVAGASGRAYRDGGGPLGGELALSWIEAGLSRLPPGGRFALYTGSPVVEGRHLLRIEIERLAAAASARLTWEELDPDVFGGTLRQSAYAEVERIAAVGVVIAL